MASKRTYTIGAIIPTMENSIFAAGIQAFQETLSAAGKTLLLASSAYDPATEEAQIRTLVARGAEGLLLIGHARSDAVYAFLEARNMPTLVAWVHDTSAPRLSVGFDNHAAMKNLAAKAIGMGHERIGMISALQAGNDRVAARIAGVRAAMDAVGLEPDDLALVETTYSMATGATALDDLMSRGSPPTLIICANDVLAVGALRQAQRRGLRVPEDVSITGFDDTELALITDPPLTSVRVPHAQMGANAAEVLIRMIDGEPPQDSLALTTDLQVRGSLAPPGQP